MDPLTTWVRSEIDSTCNTTPDTYVAGVTANLRTGLVRVLYSPVNAYAGRVGADGGMGTVMPPADSQATFDPAQLAAWMHSAAHYLGAVDIYRDWGFSKFQPSYRTIEYRQKRSQAKAVDEDGLRGYRAMSAPRSGVTRLGNDA